MLVNRKDQISKLFNLIYGLWFDTDSIIYDKEHHTVSIFLKHGRFYFFGAIELPPSSVEINSDSGVQIGNRSHACDLILTIMEVHAMTIVDTEKVGYYNLGKIEYDDNNSCIRIIGGIPVTIEVQVTSLNIILQELGNETGPRCLP